MPDVTAFMTTFFSHYSFLNELWDESDTEFSTCTKYKYAPSTHFLGGLQINIPFDTHAESFKTSCYLHMHLVCIVISKTRWDIPTILVVGTAGNINTRWCVMQLAEWVCRMSKLCAMKQWVQHKCWPVFVWSRIVFLPCLICCELIL
jgi:hypothetical protein